MSVLRSAALEATSCELLAQEYARLMEQERIRAANFRVASEAEERLEALLRPFEVMGWRLLVDRAWPRTRGANVDFVMCGPGGILVVDSKAWQEPALVDDRLYCGQAEATEDVDKTLAVTELVEGAVAGIGLAPLVVQPLFVFDQSSWPSAALGRLTLVGDRHVAAHIARLPHRLDEAAIQAAWGILESALPPYKRAGTQPLLVPAQPVEPRPLPPAQQEELFDRTEMVEAIVDGLSSAPVEEWMTFLHPDQIELVRRTWNGPARLKGAAGTGKTVVGLHRAAYVTATRPGRVLFVSFVRTLSGVLGSLLERLAPDFADRVEFKSVHAFAGDVLHARGVRSRLKPEKASAAFERAWLEKGEPSVLGRLAGDRSYWKEEIDYVLKGRGITQFEFYAEVTRVGRRTGLQREHREAVWDLYQRYDELLREADAWDFNDLLLQAQRALEVEPGDPSYVSVIVDEVQDLTAVGVRLLHQAVGDAPDGLLLIGDGQQSIYPGGFTLAEAGVAVQNRSRVLGVNYRNGARILEAALAHAGGQLYEDLEGRAESGKRVLEVARAGGSVINVTAKDSYELERHLCDVLRRTLAMDDIAPGDVALLAPSNTEVGRWIGVLERLKIPATPLTDYDGRVGSGVKVGTTHRAKGLEFKYVFLPGHGRRPGRRTGESDATYAERCERRLREEFVAMTRARDGLWCGRLERDGHD